MRARVRKMGQGRFRSQPPTPPCRGRPADHPGALRIRTFLPFLNFLPPFVRSASILFPSLLLSGRSPFFPSCWVTSGNGLLHQEKRAKKPVAIVGILPSERRRCRKLLEQDLGLLPSPLPSPLFVYTGEKVSRRFRLSSSFSRPGPGSVPRARATAAPLPFPSLSFRSAVGLSVWARARARARAQASPSLPPSRLERDGPGASSPLEAPARPPSCPVGESGPGPGSPAAGAMAASAKRKQEEKHLKLLREMSSLPPNRKCFDCDQRGPTYTDMTVGSFVCTSCSGIL